MSNFVKHEAPKPAGLKFALIFGALWAVLVAVLWYFYRSYEGEGGGFLHFLGRFHVILVHMPVGVVILALVLEAVSFLPSQRYLRSSIPFILWIALFGGIAATILGYILMGSEGGSGRLMDLHMWTGLAVVVCTLLALVFFLLEKRLLYLLMLIGAFVTVSAAGHFGGAMVHEKDYLSQFAPESLKPLLLAGLDSEASHKNPNVEEGVVEVPLEKKFVYSELVVPILEGKCNECHNADKIKGKLRLDTHELIMAGAEGSDYPTVVPGDAEASEFIVRVTLPSDDDDFMPPKGDGLTAEEIKILSAWIQAGATQELTVAELGDDPALANAAASVIAMYEGDGEAVDNWEPVWDSLTDEERQARIEDAMGAAGQHNFSIMPISAEDNRLRVNVINAAKNFGDEQLKLLDPIAEQVVWLDLARSQVTDDGMTVVSHMRNLERLHLENTQVSDEGIAKLAPLVRLKYLNLYSTSVGNGIFATLENMPHLQKLYVWQTKVDPAEARAFERSVNLEINTGVDVAEASVGEVEKPEVAEKKPEEKPKPETQEKAKPKAPAKAKADAKPQEKPKTATAEKKKP